MRLGGAERHVLALARGMAERGFQTGIGTFFREGVLAKDVRSSGIPFECLGADSSWGISTLRESYRFLARLRPDILHTYLFGFHFFSGLPAKLLKIPAVLSSRREIPYWRKRRHLVLENAGNFFTDKIVCCSKAAEKWTRETEWQTRGKLLTIRNGVDETYLTGPRTDAAARIRESWGIPPGARVVGTVANLSREKGYESVIQAAGEVLRTHPDVWFVFVGAGPLEEDLRSRAGLVSQTRFVFTGPRLDIPDIMTAFDIFLLGSLWEGFPNVLLEAMALGRPVVSTLTGGIPELIENEADGLLVPPAQSGLMAGALLRLLKCPELALRLGQAGKQKIARDFTQKRMLDDYEVLYRSLLNEKSGTFHAGGGEPHFQPDQEPEQVPTLAGS